MGSVRSERVVYRESDRDYEEAPRRTYTTIKRYQVPEAISRSVYQEDEEVKDKLVVKRERRDASRETRRDDVEYRVSERERERDAPRRDIHYRVVERDSDFDRSRSEFRVVDRERSSVRAPSPPSEERERVYRFERERDFSPARERDFDVERYSKSTEYFTQPQAAPQPIIIRESRRDPPIIIRESRRDPPIIIREERREPHYEFIEKEETKEETKSVVKRQETPEPTPTPEPPPQQKPEEDYFYERRVVERRRDRSNSVDRKSEVRPRDSASQYSSDDSYEYVRRERTVDDDGRSHSPHHKRHLAEGAIAGIGAAEILRRHRSKQGRGKGHRGRDLIGGAAVGALAAEGISRVRSMRSLRRGSRSRSSSFERDSHRHGRRRRSHSRSHSLSRAQQLGGLAAVAAVGALAGYAINKNRNKETVIINDRPHRSRSRRRRSGAAHGYDVENDARDPDHRNRRIAQAGLASAAAAGIWEKVRSRSRGGKSRERSRLRTGVPIAAAGLGGAALAGLYEKNKANKEAKRDAIIEDELHRGRHRRSRSRSRNRSRSLGAPYPASDGRGGDMDRGMIAYGNEPIPGAESHGGYYSDEEPGVYRRRRGSSGSSPDTRNRRGSRSRSRARDLAGAGLAAGAGGLAAHEYDRRRDHSRGDRDRAYHQDDQYHQGQPYSPPPVGNNAGYNNGGYAGPHQQQPYPNAPYFPPPPTGEAQPGQGYAEQNAYPAYNPADYSNQPHPGQQPHNADAGLAYGAADHQQPGPDGRRGADPENVSSPETSSREMHEEPQEADGVNTPRPRSGSHVHFALDSNASPFPDSSQHDKDHSWHGGSSGRHRSRLNDRSENRDDVSDEASPPRGSDRRRRHHSGSSSTTHSHRDSPDLMHDPSDHRPRAHHRDSDLDSDGTVELPARFDEHGNRKAEGPLTDRLQELFSGAGGSGGLLKNLAEGLLGGGHGDDSDDGRTSSRRRHRR